VKTLAFVPLAVSGREPGAEKLPIAASVALFIEFIAMPTIVFEG
jgi:hypothetical protein